MLKHIRIEAHEFGRLTRLFLDGEPVVNATAYKVEADKDGLTTVTLSFIPETVELEGDVFAHAVTVGAV
jgi:hypothetical protein